MHFELLETHLQSEEMPFVVHSDQGLAWGVHEKLWGLAKNRLSEEQFESFLEGKLEAATENLEFLETVEYPEVATDHHTKLYSAFVLYQEALACLEEFLWSEADVQLHEILRLLLQADKEVGSFSEELAGHLDDIPSLGKVW